MYDGMDISTFQVSPNRSSALLIPSNKDLRLKAHVNAVGPAIFTIIHTFPGFAVTILLCKEMIVTSESFAMGALQVVLAFLPGLLQVLWEALLLYRKSLALAPSTAPTSGELPRYVGYDSFTALLVCSICMLDSSA
jgi:hypothetical protein